MADPVVWPPGTFLEPPEVPVSLDPNRELALTLVDEWARAGTVRAFLAPGSRSTPLALALWEDPRMTVEVVLDERSAAFMALGAARASGRPVVVATTSGTAVANLHPAVMEAHHSRVPLLVASADRPAELRDCGANQTTDQHRLFGGSLRWFVEMDGLATQGVEVAGRAWRWAASRAHSETLGPPAGPVQVNLALRDPLVPTGGTGSPVPGREGGRPWISTSRPRVRPTDIELDELARLVADTPQGAVVAGWGSGASPAAVERFALAAGWPILADAVSGLRAGSMSISTYDPLLRHQPFASDHRPDTVLQLGAAPTGRAASEWSAAAGVRVVVDPGRLWPDPHRTASHVTSCDADDLLDALADRLSDASSPGRDTNSWLASWLEAETRARVALDSYLDTQPEAFEGRLARDLVASLPPGEVLAAGSSMPVRDLESFAPNAPPTIGPAPVVANRGVSGIDGFVSTVLGAALGAGRPVTALLGDLTFLHDAGGLLGAARRGARAVLVVVDNGGGAIFSFLPQAASPGISSEAFETLFATPQTADPVEVAAAYGIPATRVGTTTEVAHAVATARLTGGVSVVVASAPGRPANVEGHAGAWEAVAVALQGPSA